MIRPGRASGRYESLETNGKRAAHLLTLPVVRVYYKYMDIDGSGGGHDGR